MTRVLAWILILLTTTGCSSWKSMPLRQPIPGEAPAAPLPEHIRVNMVDGTMLDMDAARVEGDSLIGTRPKGSAPHAPSRRLAVAVMDVRSIEEHRFSGGKTTGLVLGILAFAGAAFLVAAIIVYGSAAD